MSSISIDRKDGLSSSTAIKGPVRCATTANITLYGVQTIDSVSLVDGDRVLVKNQTDGTTNGIYICDSGQWRRSTDFNKTRDVVQGTQVLVNEGNVNGGRTYIVATSGLIIIGSTIVVFQLADVLVAAEDALAETQAAAASAQASAIQAASARYELIPNMTEYGMNAGASAATNIAALAAAIAHRDATGKEVFYLPSGTYNLTGVGADIHKIILIGPGKLTGVYRKNVIDTKNTLPYRGGVTFDAARHLRNYSRKTNPVIVLVGDSLTGEDTLTSTDISDGIASALQRMLIEAFPGKAPQWNNRGIGGARWADLDGVWPGTLPIWYITPSATWLSYIEALRPDLVIISFGMNDGYSADLGNFQLQLMTSVMDKIRSWPKETDILLCTNMVPSLMSTDVTVTGRTQQEGRDEIAGIVRSYAQVGGYGYFDINRWFNVVRDGEDILDCILGPIVTATQAMSYLPGIDCRDYDLQASFAAIPANFWDIVGDGSSILRVKLSQRPDNFAVIRNQGGFIAIDIYADTNRLWFSQVTPIATPASGSAVVLRYRLIENNLFIMLNGQTIYNGMILRFGGLLTPEFRYTLNNAGATGTFALRTGLGKKYMPKMTDAEIFGFTPYEDPGANQINHATGKAQALIRDEILKQPWVGRKPSSDEVLVDRLNADIGVLIDYSRDRYVISDANGMRFGTADSITIDTGTGSHTGAYDPSGYRMGIRIPAGQGAHILLSNFGFTLTEFSLIVEGYAENTGVASYFAAVARDANGGPRVETFINASKNPAMNLVDDSTTVVASMGSLNVRQPGYFSRIGVSLKTNQAILNDNGHTAVFDIVNTVPSALTRIKLGHTNGTVVNPVVIKRVALIPVALRCEQLLARLL